MAKEGRDRDVPHGLPINVVVKVHPSVVPLGQARKPDDLVIESNKSITLTEGASTTYDVDLVYDTRATVQDMYTKTLVPLVNAFIDGVSCTILVFGTAASQRVETFQGDASRVGLIPKIIDSTFVGLQRKAKALEDRAQGHLKSNVNFSFCEIYNEVIQDLLNSQNRDLSLVEDPVDGMVVDALTLSGPHTAADSLIDQFQAGVAARSTTPSDFGPAAEYASAIFRLVVTQEIRQHRSKSVSIRSSLTVVDVAGAEKVVGRNPSAVKATEGPTLNKSSFAFKAMCAAMRGGRHAEYLPHEDSKLTLALKESFGGNCFTTAVCTLAQADVPSRGILEMAIQLREGVGYPITMDTVAQGLVRRLRLQNKAIREQLAEARTGVVSDERKVKDTDTDLMLRISELEGTSIKHNLEKLKLQEDREKLYERFREFRDKYNLLVSSKAELQRTLIDTEEGKLKVSKALLDLQLENNQLKEMVDQEKFDLGAKLMTAENDVVEMEMKYQTARERADDLTSQVEQLVEEKKELAVELVSLRTNLMSRTAELKNERSKSEDLAEHVLTLANTKAVLEQELKDAKKDTGAAAGRDEVLRGEVEGLRTKNAALEAHLKELTESYDEVQAAKIRAELQAEQLQVEYNKKKLAVERSMQEYTSNVDSEMARERERGQNEMEQLKAYRTVTDAKIKQLEASVRPLQRKIAELKLVVEERERHEASQAAEIKALEHQLAQRQEEHRRKLLDTLAGEGGAVSSEAAREKVLEDLVTSYRASEAEGSEKVKALREENHQLIQKSRKLGAAVRKLQQHVEDIAPGDEAKAAIDASVSDAMDLAEQSSLEVRLQGELDHIRRTLEETRHELVTEKERNVTYAEGFRKTILELQQQNEDLQARLERADADVERLRLIAEAGRDPAKEAETADAIATMKNQFEQHLEEMKQSQALAATAAAEKDAAEASESDKAEIQHLRAESRKLRDEMQALRKENQELRDSVAHLQEELRTAHDAVAAAAATAHPRSRRASIVVQPQAPTGPVDDSTILAQLQETEKRAVALLSRNTVLEEEVTNYKAYLKAQVKKYQQQISKLKKEVGKWKAKAKKAGAA